MQSEQQEDNQCGQRTAYVMLRMEYLQASKLGSLHSNEKMLKYVQWEWKHRISQATKTQMVILIKSRKRHEFHELPIYSDKAVWNQYERHVRQELAQKARERKLTEKEIQKHSKSEQFDQTEKVQKRLRSSSSSNFEDEYDVEQKLRKRSHKDQNEKSLKKRKRKNVYLEEEKDERYIQIQEDSSLLFKMVDDYGDKSKKNKHGLTKVAYCQYCNTQHAFKTRIIDHKKKCKERLKTKKIKKQSSKMESSINLMKEQVLNIVEQSHSPQQLQLLQENRLLKQQIARINGQKYVNNEQQLLNRSEFMATQIISSTQQTIIQLITNKLTNSILHAIRGGNDVSLLTSQIKMKLINKFNNLSLDDIVLCRNSSLEGAHKQLISRSIGKSERTRQDYESAKAFFSKYTDFDLHYQSRIICGLTRQSNDRIQQLKRYYNKLRKYNPKLPNLIQTDSKFPWKVIRPMKSFGVIVSLIAESVQPNNLTLISDMWMYVCLGLRPRELKKVRILAESGNGAMLIKMKETKTHQTIIRYIPKSLIQLVKFTKASYPMSESRLDQLKDAFFNSGIRLFYSLRHVHAFNFAQAAHRAFGNSSFYGYQEKQCLTLSEQMISCLDQIYSFNFPFQQQFKQERIMIDLISNRQVQISNYLDQVVSVDSNRSIFEGYEQDYVLTYLTPFIIKSIDQISFEQKQLLTLNSVLYQNFRKQISQEHLSTSGVDDLLDYFCYLLNDYKCKEHICNEHDEKGRALTKKQILQTAAEFIDKSIVLAHYSSVQIFHPFEAYQYDPQNAIVIAYSSKGLHFVDQELNQSDLQKYSSKVSQFQNKKQNVQIAKAKLSQLQPKCRLCKKKLQMLVQPQSKRGYFACQKCNQEIKEFHNTEIRFKDCSQVIITGNGKYQFDRLYTELKPNKKVNNLKQQIERYQGNGCYSTQTRYSFDIPNQIVTNYSCFSTRMAKIIKSNRQNQEYLPLQITNSSVESAGKGVFATDDIPKNVIILSYIGTIASNFTTNMSNDSLFHLGWLHHKQAPRQLLINTQTICNAARFINSSDKIHPENCKPVIAILDNQIAVILVSIQEIKSGKELFYDYGDGYWKTNKQIDLIEKTNLRASDLIES